MSDPGESSFKNEHMRRVFRAILQEVVAASQRLAHEPDPAKREKLLAAIMPKFDQLAAENSLPWGLIDHLQRDNALLDSQREEAMDDQESLYKLVGAALRESYQLGWWAYDKQGARLSWSPTLAGIEALIENPDTPLLQVIHLLSQR